MEIETFELSFNDTGALLTFDRKFPSSLTAPGTLTIDRLGYVSLIGGAAAVFFTSPLSSDEQDMVMHAAMILVCEFDPFTHQLRKYDVSLLSEGAVPGQSSK